MEINNLITVEEFCANYDIEISFVNSLRRYGLIEITTIEETDYFEEQQLQKMDRYIRFYYELNIGSEGIASIRHLFFHVNAMCEKITRLRNQTCLN